MKLSHKIKKILFTLCVTMPMLHQIKNDLSFLRASNRYNFRKKKCCLTEGKSKIHEY